MGRLADLSRRGLAVALSGQSTGEVLSVLDGEVEYEVDGTVTTNGGVHGSFESAGAPADGHVLPVPSAPDPVVLTALAAEHGIEMLPPPGA